MPISWTKWDGKSPIEAWSTTYAKPRGRGGSTSKGSDEMDAGLALVEHLFREMQVDDQWSVRHERGFTWWAAGLAQRVWAEPPVDDFGVQLSRVHVQTDFLTGVRTDKQLERLGVFTPYATMSGLVVHESEVRLAASIFVHSETLEMWKRLLSTAALLQVVDAHATVKATADFTESRPAMSSHPDNGARENADDMLNVVRDVFAPLGSGPSLYVGPDFVGAEKTLGPTVSVLTTADETGLTSEFPFGDNTALLQMLTDVKNPKVGHGLLLILRLPAQNLGADRGRLALALNKRELTEFSRTPFIGSWCPDPELEHCISFVSFLPNGCALPGLPSNLLMYSAARAKWAFEVFHGETPATNKKVRPALLRWLSRERS